MGYYKIADIIFEFKNIDYDYFHTRMSEYRLNTIPEKVDVSVTYYENNNIIVPESEYIAGKNNKRWIKDDSGYTVYDYYDEFKKTFTYIKANIDWSVVEYTVSDTSEEFGITNEERCFNIPALIMYNVILFKKGIVIHSSAIDYKGNGIAFLAPSGTGKSTHTGLWKKYYPGDVTVINDDSPAVKLVGDRLKMYGTPWSGKTSINANRCVDLNAIVFLRQAHENSIRRVKNPIEALQVILPETYKPVFEELANYNMDMLDILIRNVPMYIMYCNISKEAVDMVKDNVID